MDPRFSQIPDKAKAERLSKIYEEKENLKHFEKRLQENLALNYRYIRTWDERYNKDGAVSFSWKRQGDKIVYAVALQSHKDSFSRRYARKVMNRRFSTGQTQSFTFISDTAIRDMGPILALHYNSLRTLNGIKNVPKYLRHISIELGW